MKLIVERKGLDQQDHNVKILGIDPGLAKTGFAVVQNNKILEIGVVSTVKTKQLYNTGLRINKIRMAFTNLINTHNPDIVCFEEFFFSKKGANGASTAKVLGALMSDCSSYGINYCIFSPRDVKVAFGGSEAVRRKQKGETEDQKRTRQKKAVADGVRMFLGDVYFDQNHESDAAAIALGYFKLKSLE